MAKFSDAKFLEQTYKKAEEAKAPKPQAKLASEDVKALRGIFSRHAGTPEGVIERSLQEDGEPVSFIHPDSNLRIYGWLVETDIEGNSRVALNDGEYVIVPESELRPFGAAAGISAEEVHKALHQKLPFRADLHETLSPTEISIEDETMHLINLSYAASKSDPTSADIMAYVDYHYPEATIVDAEIFLPGKIAVVVKSEMGPAHGGEVLETLNPETDVVEGDFHKHGPEEKKSKTSAVSKEAIWPFDSNKVPNVDPKSFAQAAMRDTSMVDEILKVYFNNNGGKVLAKIDRPFNTKSLLEAAAPVVQRANPKLWKQVAQAATSATNNPGPGKPGEPNASGVRPGGKPVQPTMPTGQPGASNAQSPGGQIPTTAPSGASWTQENINQAVSDATNPYSELVQDLQGPKPGSPAAPLTPQQQQQQKQVPGAHPFQPTGSYRAASVFAKKSFEMGVVPKPEFGVPDELKYMPSGKLMKSMKLDGDPIRKGDYVCVDVSWDSKDLAQVSELDLKTAIASFVRSQVGSRAQGMDFGAIGKLYLKEFKKGKATVMFAATLAGPSSLSTSD